MRFFIGTDEAGYGPNLGPLLVSATAWQIEESSAAADFYGLLSTAVTAEAPKKGDRRLHLADSKAVYAPAHGLAALERGVLTLAGLLGNTPTQWRQVWAALAPAAWDELAASACYSGFDCELPLAAGRDDVAAMQAQLQEACEVAGVRLLAIRARAVFPDEFNGLIESQGNKAGALSCVTLRLAAELLDSLPDGDVELVCDKHGGRNSYAPLLQQHVTECWVECLREAADESLYRFGTPLRRVSARFCCRAERYPPVAAASMVSKYLREISMKAFNAFWRRHVPELRPTAGYPLDAKRFKREIAAAQTALGMADRVLWRTR
ncbi:MAG: hypothetical protein AB7O62_02605 [Pirellulales bacterium]